MFSIRENIPAFQALSSERIFFSGVSWRIQKTAFLPIDITGYFIMLLPIATPAHESRVP